METDYTFKNLIPDQTYLKKYNEVVEVVFIFTVKIKGENRK